MEALYREDQSTQRHHSTFERPRAVLFTSENDLQYVD